MNEFFCSARGESATTWLDTPKSKRSKLPWPAVKLVYPSHQTVKDSVSGIRVNALQYVISSRDTETICRKEILCSVAQSNGRLSRFLKNYFTTRIAREGES